MIFVAQAILIAALPAINLSIKFIWLLVKEKLNTTHTQKLH